MLLKGLSIWELLRECGEREISKAHIGNLSVSVSVLLLFLEIILKILLGRFVNETNSATLFLKTYQAHAEGNDHLKARQGLFGDIRGVVFDGKGVLKGGRWKVHPCKCKPDQGFHC